MYNTAILLMQPDGHQSDKLLPKNSGVPPLQSGISTFRIERPTKPLLPSNHPNPSLHPTIPTISNHGNLPSGLGNVASSSASFESMLGSSGTSEEHLGGLSLRNQFNQLSETDWQSLINSRLPNTNPPTNFAPSFLRGGHVSAGSKRPPQVLPSGGAHQGNWMYGQAPLTGRNNEEELFGIKPNFPPDFSLENSFTTTQEIKTVKYFKLLQEPNEKQRKSYVNENRYILPNPITLVPENSSDTSKIEGNITVKLVSENCDEFSQEREFLLEGTKSKEIDAEKKVQFSLKILETSEGNKFRLFFQVDFKKDGVRCKQVVISQPFKVTSNKKKNTIEKPKAFTLIPREGYANAETEVWIKGKGFNDRANIGVTFGGQEARIAETEENILICYAPKRLDLIKDTAVSVTVYNTHPADGKMSSDRQLVFTYLVEEPEPSKKRKILQREDATI